MGVGLSFGGGEGDTRSARQHAHRRVPWDVIAWLQAKKNEVSESYAKALVELADEKGKLEAVHADVDALASLVKENKKLSALLSNPVVDAEKKRQVLLKIGKEAGFQAYTTNFLNLLCSKDRLALLDEICDSFEEFYCKLTDTQVRTSRMPRRAAQYQQRTHATQRSMTAANSSSAGYRARRCGGAARTCAHSEPTA